MKLTENISLLPYNTFHIDAKAKLFAEYENVDELRKLLLTYKDEKMLHIGAGSNLLFTKNFDGLILHSAMRQMRVVCENEQNVYLQAESAIVMDELIAHLCEQGLSGMENLSYIPGEVGASAVQNVGAYGVEAKDIIDQVYAIDISNGTERIFTNEQCQYGYRDSIFKNELKGKYIITSVVFRLNKTLHPKLEYGGLAREVPQNPTVIDIRNTIIRTRKQKLPEVNELGSAGSFFKNPIISHDQYKELTKQYESIPNYEQEGGIKIPAAWLIEQCGWKGKMHGGAQCYDKQPLVIVNKNNATGQDIIELAELICTNVKEKFNIVIIPEVNYI